MDKEEYKKLLLSKYINYSELQSEIIASMPETLVRYRTFNEKHAHDELVNGNVFYNIYEDRMLRLKEDSIFLMENNVC